MGRTGASPVPAGASPAKETVRNDSRFGHYRALSLTPGFSRVFSPIGEFNRFSGLYPCKIDMTTDLLKIETPAEFSAAVHRAAELLQRGEVVAVPTETVYGLAANALDADAV